jgi:predicted amidophosphoribosyltransferase
MGQPLPMRRGGRRPAGVELAAMPEMEGTPLPTCERCGTQLPEVLEDGLCEACEKAMVEHIEARSQQHRENPLPEA